MESRRAVSSTVQASSFVVNKDGRVAFRWSCSEACYSCGSGDFFLAAFDMMNQLLCFTGDRFF